jgi:ADP-heptose:LPS heptosyltransferase
VKILAIRLARFGDIVLLLPALRYLKTSLPGSHLTFLTDQRWGPLAAMCPAIDDVITIDRLGMRDGSLRNAIAGIWRVGREIRSRRFDAVIDFHGFRETSLIAWWSGAPKRMGLRRFDQSYWGWCFNLPAVDEDKNIHFSEMFLRVARAFSPEEYSPVAPGPALRVPAGTFLPAAPYVALYIDAPVKERIWPKDRFKELARHFVERHGVAVVVLAGADPHWENPGKGVHVFSGLAIAELAAIIAGARLFVSNDTGPMHLGPALGVPTLALFSVGFPEHFRPTGTNDLVLRGNPIEEVGTADVIEAAERLWASQAIRDY